MSRESLRENSLENCSISDHLNFLPARNFTLNFNEQCITQFNYCQSFAVRESVDVYGIGFFSRQNRTSKREKMKANFSNRLIGACYSYLNSTSARTMFHCFMNDACTARCASPQFEIQLLYPFSFCANQCCLLLVILIAQSPKVFIETTAVSARSCSLQFLQRKVTRANTRAHTHTHIVCHSTIATLIYCFIYFSRWFSHLSRLRSNKFRTRKITL